jgi:hypothetical protein
MIISDDPKIGMELTTDWGVVRVIGGLKTYGLIFS